MNPAETIVLSLACLAAWYGWWILTGRRNR